MTTGPTETALVNAYAAARSIPATTVAGVRTGSLKTGTIASTHTTWAVASFLPSAADSATVADSFQDGASTGMFSSVNGATWKFVQTGGAPLYCAGVLPAAVQQALQLTASTGGCSSPMPDSSAASASAPADPTSTTTSTTSSTSATTPSAASTAYIDPSKIVSTANGSVGVSDSPATTSFGFDCNPYTTLVGNPDGAGQSGCGYNSRYEVTNTNEEWCADYTKYVWEQGGVDKDLGTLDPGAASFYTWGKDQGESMPTDPAAKDAVAGDAVVFYPAGDTPNGSYADHVGIVVKVNSNGTLDLVNGDFLGGSNISVQANDNVDLSTWASAVWASGEKWIFVSPGQAAPPAPQGGVRQASQAAGQSDGTVDVFYTDTSGYLEHEVYLAKGGWGKPSQFGDEKAVGEPSVTTSSPGTVDVFFQGANSQMWHASYTPTGGWTAEQDMTDLGTLGSAPEAVAQVNGDVDVFWRGTDNHLWHADYVPGHAWSGPQDLGGTLASAPSPAQSSPGEIDVFFKGTDGHLWHVVHSPSGWGTAQSLGMGTLGSAPEATGELNGTVDVFWQSTGTSPSVEHAWYNPGKTWAGPQSVGGTTTTVPTAVSDGHGDLQVLFQGSNGELWRFTYTPKTGWSKATDMTADGKIGSAPFASGKPTGTFDVFWKAASGAPNLWHAWLNPGTDWAGPQNLQGDLA